MSNTFGSRYSTWHGHPGCVFTGWKPVPHSQYQAPSIVLVLLLACLAQAEPLTLPLDQRPDWLSRDGNVMAGSWEPLLFRVRRDGSEGYSPSAEQLAAYEREHSPEMIAELKALGVNFIMMHCYKGAGLQAERESMTDAVRFAQLCRESGLRVGVYNFSGAFLWEPLFKERPEAKDWVLLGEDGKPLTYGGGAAYRYRWNRNHAGAEAFYRQLARFAVQEIKADLLHFDNYGYGPGYDANSVERFRDYLGQTFTAGQLKEMGVSDSKQARPPAAGQMDSLLGRAWLDFSCRSLAESYHRMSRYARTLRKDILIECNPGGPGDRIRPPVDHGRLLDGGEAFWDEGQAPGYEGTQLRTRIRTYKLARRMDNVAFAYATTPLEMAESMAFNRDCLGCVCWFEYGKIVARPGSNEPMADALAPFIRFFHSRRGLLGNADIVTDVAVLRSFASQVFGGSDAARLTYQAEQALIESCVPFQTIYDCHLNELKRYRALILAGCVALSDEQTEQIERYVKSGGRLVVVGRLATHDQWLRPREKPRLDDLPADRVIRIENNSDLIGSIRRACDEQPSMSIKAEPGLCAELTEQPGRRLVHLVNYRGDVPAENVAVSLRLPFGRHVTGATLVSPERANELELSFQEQDGLATFSVPQVRTYEIAVVTMK